MARLTLEQILIGNLKQIIPKEAMMYLAQENAIERLKQITGQDFGYDVEAWEKYLKDLDGHLRLS